ncbi:MULTISPECIES: hypothetical protein [Streptomyces]|uniref:Uncharacterized protein n=2 Tax=Streptomyces rimosus subsp. rimosus TaxID=132474 RepID=L8EXX7_STRR1|nr:MULTISPECIES: hypothetical protein [Streptomyces]KOG70498.1 hypothetical protein ADK78_28295 [Kitasatospora aureofaciens]MYT47268.1 hypothetical protein [Streptomyces sp. SID5471]KEF04602.1 hypothetical protein DF17_22170 [Streptomyces rimosus]KEF19973.1 hypothetical protein DF18_14205 [Streptomyces rimosus]KOT31330.1 hypothetical protein ADK84_29810 [Streptomyces sp. NRRL WC-3701]
MLFWLDKAVLKVWNLLADACDAAIHGGRLKSDYRVSFPGGLTVDRVERGRQVRWWVNGEPVTESTAKARLQVAESASRHRRP